MPQSYTNSPTRPYQRPATWLPDQSKVPREHLANLPGPGWLPLVEHLHEELLKLDPDYRLTCVKEKLGILCVYVQVNPEVRKRAHRLIRKVQDHSARVCELCGAPGRLRMNPRRRADTFCDRCFDRHEELWGPKEPPDSPPLGRGVEGARARRRRKRWQAETAERRRSERGPR